MGALVTAFGSRTASIERDKQHTVASSNCAACVQALCCAALVSNSAHAMCHAQSIRRTLDNLAVWLQVELFLLDSDGKWKEKLVPAAVRALIFCNLQSYAGGRDLWKHGAQVRAFSDLMLFLFVHFNTRRRAFNQHHRCDASNVVCNPQSSASGRNLHQLAFPVPSVLVLLCCNLWSQISGNIPGLRFQSCTGGCESWKPGSQMCSNLEHANKAGC